MKTLRTIVMAGALCALACPSRAELASAIQAIVDDAVVTYQEVEIRTARAEGALVQEYRAQPRVLEGKIEEVRADNLRQLVENQLILHEFKTAGYSLPESILDELVQDSIKSEFGDRATATKTLEARGINFEKYRQQIRERFIIAQLRLKNVNQEIIISPYKIEQYYSNHKDQFKVEDRVKLRMIVLNHSPEARKLAEEALGKVEAGVPFADMATEVTAIYPQASKPAKGGEGGDWGWYDLSVLRKEWAEAAGRLQAGQHSGVIESPDAYCLMQVEERQPARYKTLSEVRDEIEASLRIDESNRLTKQWIDKLRRKTFVRYY